MEKEIGEIMISDFDLEGKNKFQKVAYYLKCYGLGYTFKKAMRKLGVPISEESEYMTWLRGNVASKVELSAQRKDSLSDRLSFVIVSEKGTGSEQAGWKKQTCKRVTFATIDKNTGISALLEQNEGDVFVFSGREVKVPPEYLYEVTLAICGQANLHVSKLREENISPVDLVYTDEDNCAEGRRLRPFFKPDASLNLLLNFPYLGRCFAVTRHLLEKMAKPGDAPELFGNDWYDLSLQAFRHAKHIFHIPKPLFSNLVPKEEKTMFVRSRGKRAAACLTHYLKSENISGRVLKSDVPGFFHVVYELAQEPLVSIIIPNKDHAEDLKCCLDSLKQNDYGNYEVIVAENNSEKKETFAYYKKIITEDPRIHVAVWKGEFNYSAINNFAVGKSKGDLILFLNNDTEFIGKRALRELVISALKPGVGACGAMLYYGDKTIQHAGVIIGMGGFAAHALWSLTDRDERYYPFSLCEREVSAVTGACLMVQRTVYEEAGGMGEDFAVALNDVDFCLKIRALGYKILWNPYARLFHYESKSRGYEDTAEKQKRFQKEIERFQEKWETEIVEGDPCYNPNLTLHRADYSMDI